MSTGKIHLYEPSVHQRVRYVVCGRLEQGSKTTVETNQITCLRCKRVLAKRARERRERLALLRRVIDFADRLEREHPGIVPRSPR